MSKILIFYCMCAIIAVVEQEKILTHTFVKLTSRKLKYYGIRS